jgi:molybdopterin molybdotransferase
MISVDEALERIFAVIPDLGSETVPLAKAHGRVLAVPLIAAHTQPPFDSSAMDGYAVHADDVTPGRSLWLAGASQAGQRFVGMMDRGQCVRIFTGAPLPIGADAVIVQEEATVSGAMVSFAKQASPGQSIRRRGNDFIEGQELLPAGTLLRPAALNLAAAANRPQLPVTRRPLLALLATGDELVAPGEQLGPDQIVASNSVGLLPTLEPYAGAIVDLGIVGDDPKLLDAALLRAFDSGVEVVVTTGGASVGDRDYMHDVLIDLGVELDFWKIAMRPGKPLMFGTRGKTLIFGLPGNPVSAMVTATVILLPALRAICRYPNPLGTRYMVPLAASLPPNGSRRHFLRGMLSLDPLGFQQVTPIAETDSAHLSSFARADVLIVQPENDPGLPTGAPVEVILLED